MWSLNEFLCVSRFWNIELLLVLLVKAVFRQYSEIERLDARLDSREEG